MNEMSNHNADQALLSLAVEGWKFSRSYLRLISQLDAGEMKRFNSQLRYFQKQLESNLNDVGYKLVNLEGQPFDPGMAATAINASDFSQEDKLIVDQMLEPVIMNNEGIIKMGTVILKQVSK